MLGAEGGAEQQAVLPGLRFEPVARWRSECRTLHAREGLKCCCSTAPTLHCSVHEHQTRAQLGQFDGRLCVVFVSGSLCSLHEARSEEGTTIPDCNAGHQALPVKGMGHWLAANLKGPGSIPADQAEQLSMVLPPALGARGDVPFQS